MFDQPYQKGKVNLQNIQLFRIKTFSYISKYIQEEQRQVCFQLYAKFCTPSGIIHLQNSQSSTDSPQPQRPSSISLLDHYSIEGLNKKVKKKNAARHSNCKIMFLLKAKEAAGIWFDLTAYQSFLRQTVHPALTEYDDLSLSGIRYLTRFQNLELDDCGCTVCCSFHLTVPCFLIIYLRDS